MELGAFVAGMLISETEYRYQVEEDIKPFRDLLLGLFFITIGMKLNLGVVLAYWPQVLVLLVMPVVVKFALIAGLVYGSGAGAPTAIRTGIWLAQAGEFAFVLLVLALNSQVIAPETVQPVLAAMLLSILISPFLISQAGRIVLRASNQEWLQRSLQLQKIATQIDRPRAPRHRLRLRPQRPEPGPRARVRGRRLRGARPRSRPRAARRQRRRIGGVRRRDPARDAAGRRHPSGERAGRDLRRHAAGR